MWNAMVNWEPAPVEELFRLPHPDSVAEVGPFLDRFATYLRTMPPGPSMGRVQCRHRCMPATRHAFGGNKLLFTKMVYCLALDLARARAVAFAPQELSLDASIAWRVSVDSFASKTFHDACLR